VINRIFVASLIRKKFVKTSYSCSTPIEQTNASASQRKPYFNDFVAGENSRNSVGDLVLQLQQENEALRREIDTKVSLLYLLTPQKFVANGRNANLRICCYVTLRRRASCRRTWTASSRSGVLSWKRRGRWENRNFLNSRRYANSCRFPKKNSTYVEVPGVLNKLRFSTTVVLRKVVFMRTIRKRNSHKVVMDVHKNAHKMQFGLDAAGV